MNWLILIVAGLFEVVWAVALKMSNGFKNITVDAVFVGGIIGLKYSVKESDWKLFRKLLPEWQERFIGRLLGEYSTMLAGQGLASDKFWRLQKRLQKDVRKVGVCAEMRRSVIDMNLRSLLLEGAISKDDLDGFSEELRQSLTTCF